MNILQLQLIWSALTPEERRTVDEFTRTHTLIELVTYDSHETISSDKEHDFNTTKIPELEAGDATTSNEPDRAASYNCDICSDWFSLEDGMSIGQQLIGHVCEHHLEEAIGRSLPIPDAKPKSSLDIDPIETPAGC